ncbi:MAG: hypothetical protein IT462_06365 [Planctomycetes bacterium]|nr:hypothetical protein [Planctomycetota bacterium]
MSEAHATAHGHAGETAHGHGEHLEVWPDAGITEYAHGEPVHLWLIVVYIVLGTGMVVAYLHQFFWHSEGYPKYGPNYAQMTDNDQYPDKINPKIDMPRELIWRVGEESTLLLKATGGRVGRVWSVIQDDPNKPGMPPGVEMKQTKLGFALVGTPTEAGEFVVHLMCKSGSGWAEHTLLLTVEEAAVGQ